MTKDSKTLRGRFEERFRNTFTDLTEGSEEDFAYTRLTEDVLSFLQSEIALAKKEGYVQGLWKNHGIKVMNSWGERFGEKGSFYMKWADVIERADSVFVIQ